MLKSTGSAVGILVNVEFNDEELTKRLDPANATPGDGRDNIVVVSSKWDTYVRAGYVDRRRHAKLFSNCIIFTVLSGTREYKIKLFTNGKFLFNKLVKDMSDIKQPLQDLVTYLTPHFHNPISIAEMRLVMRTIV